MSRYSRATCTLCQQAVFCGGDGKWRHVELKPWRCTKCGNLHYDRGQFQDRQMEPYLWCPQCGGTMRIDHEPVAAARSWADQALRNADQAWGVDGPKIEVLAGRIALGEQYCQEHPEDKAAATFLGQLRQAHAQELKRPPSVRHHKRWQQAFDAFQEALTKYLAAVAAARERAKSPQQTRLV